MTLYELRRKDVINTCTGASLGRVTDIEFCLTDGRVTGLVVPGEFSLGDYLRGERSCVVIPWGNVCRIGEDVVLVEVAEGQFC